MNIIILGAGGHGRVVLDILQQAREHVVKAFLDSNQQLWGRRVDGVPVLGGPDLLADLAAQDIEGAVVAIGDNGIRRQFADTVDAAGLELVNAIHPSANLARTVTVGCNVVIAAGALVCAHCQVGDSVILNTGCIIDHESMIGTAAHVCPGVKIAGHVTVESGAFLGIGSTVIQNIRIGYDAVIGAGSVVIEDIEPMTTVVGVPARMIKNKPVFDPALVLQALKPAVALR